MTQGKYLTVDPVTGVVLAHCTGPEQFLPVIAAGREDITIVDEFPEGPAYLDQGVVTLRQDYALEALPLPCTLTIEGIEYPCAEQPVFEFTEGSYEIHVNAGPAFLEKTFVYDQA